MNKEIKALESELALVKLQFSERIRGVEERLDELAWQDDVRVSSTPTQPSELYTEQLAQVEQKITDQVAIEVSEQTIKPTTLAITTEQYLKAQEQQYSPGFIVLFFQAMLSSLFDWLSPVTKIYKSYKERGMLGIFTLTIVGITLTLAGFGYLMQLLIDQMAAGAKSLLMAFAAVSVIGVGIGLKLKTQLSEFATAIVALGILLAYSTIYFSGSIYQLLPTNVVLFCYLLIAISCHGLALKLDTKVVAALGIIGIATMPILSDTIKIEAFSYLLSLAFVSASTLVLAYRYLGPWLANLTLAFVIIAIEWVVTLHGVDISAWTVNLFYLMFFAYSAWSLFNTKDDHKQIFIFLAALVGATVLLFFQASDLFSGQMSISFMLNSLVAGVVAVLFYKIRHQATHFLILLASLWMVLAIVSAISNSYWGIAWAAEGLLLLLLARKYLISSVIHQGQSLLAIALIYSYFALMPYFPLPALKSVDGWLLSLVIAGVIACWQRMINHSSVFDDLTVNKIKPLLQLLESLWLSIIVIACATIWLGQWTGAVVILLQLGLLFRAKHCKQVSIEIFSALLIVVPLVYVYLGSMSVESYRFMTLPLYAKSALISAFIQLWLWSEFYRRYQADSAIKNIAEAVRIVFYLLIPICWLGSAFRRLDENAAMIFWLSPAIALFFAEKIKHPLLVLETKLLTVLTSVFLVVVIAQMQLLTGFIALLGFLSFYFVAYWLDRKSTTDTLYWFICSWALISLGFAVPIFVGLQVNNIFITALLIAVYWVMAFNRIKLSTHLKRNELFISVINVLILLVAWLLTDFKAYYAVLPCLFLFACLYQKESRFKHYLIGKLFGSHCDLLLHSIAAITYSLWLVSLTQYRLDLLIAPVLAIHGALILFLKDKSLTTVKYSFVLISLGIGKLALIDAVNALLWQKVILFMGIGIFILLASFGYQKMISKESEVKD